MKKFIFLFSVLVLSGISIKAQNFTINTYHSDHKNELQSICISKDIFYCIDNQQHFYKIDKSGKSTFLCKTKQKFISVLNRNDSILAYTCDLHIFYFTGHDFQLLNNKTNPQPFFEDDDYIAYPICKGEWGGSIFFVDKKTKNKYGCQATCPLIVNKIRNKYFVTASLAHMGGFSTILEIKDPTKLTPYQEPINEKKYRNIVEEILTGTDGAKVLVDTIGVMTLASFKYKDELYHIITENEFKSKRDGTNICTIKDGRYKIISRLSDKSLWSYEMKNIKSKDGDQFYLFNNSEVNGFIYFKENKISIYYFRPQLKTGGKL